MKLEILALLTLLGWTAEGSDPRLRIQPERPLPGKSLTVTYVPAGGPLEKSSILKLVYGFTQFQTERVPLVPQGEKFTVTITPPADAVFFWCWVEGVSEDENDKSGGGGWSTYLYDANGNPVQGARQELAFTYTLRKKPVDANTVALMLLEEELRAHPENPVVRSRWWALRFEEAGKTIAAKDSILREIMQFYDSNLDKPWAYRAAALGYNHMQRNEQGLEVIRAFLKRFPENASNDSTILFFIGNWGTMADLESLPSVSKRWLKSQEYWSSLFYAYDRAKVEPAKLRKAGTEWLAFVPREKDKGGEVRTRIAEAWLARGVDPVAAEAVAREAVSIAEIGPKPALLAAMSNRKLARSFIVAVNRSTLGWALFEQGKYKDALRELDAAAAVREKENITARAVEYRRGRTLEKLDRSPDALEAYLRELAFGALPEPTRAAIATLYPKVHGNSTGMEEDIRSRVNELIAVSAIERDEPIEDVKEKLGRFDLRGLDGKVVDLSQYRGKTILIEFWATWCGSCLKSMEHTQKLAKAFAEQVVVFAVSQDGEETRARAPEYLRDKGYGFVLLFDEERRRDLQVSYVPARILVDKTGMVRVRESGWTASQEVAFEKKLRGLIAEP